LPTHQHIAGMSGAAHFRQAGVEAALAIQLPYQLAILTSC
jgi:hypothetical protein